MHTRPRQWKLTNVASRQRSCWMIYALVPVSEEYIGSSTSQQHISAFIKQGAITYYHPKFQQYLYVFAWYFWNRVYKLRRCFILQEYYVTLLLATFLSFPNLPPLLTIITNILEHGKWSCSMAHTPQRRWSFIIRTI